MSIIHILSLFVVLLFLPATAQAESPFTGGMKYTAVRKANNAAPQNATAGTMQQKTISNRATPPPEETQDTPASKVWKKYKALAAGQDSEPEKTDKLPNAPQTTGSAPEPAQAEASTAPAATGIAGIIQKYQENKEQRSQLHTIRANKVQKPDLPDKPNVAAPTVAGTQEN